MTEKPDAPTLSPDGQYLAYRITQTASKLSDIVLYNITTGTTTIWTTSQQNRINDHSYSPSFSRNSAFLLFQSAESDLMQGDFNASDDIFLKALPSIAFDKAWYGPQETAQITLNYRVFGAPWGDGTVKVRVQSDLDPVGFEIPLKQIGSNIDISTSSAAGQNLGFTSGPSDSTNKQIQVTEAGRFWVIFDPPLPGATLTNFAHFTTNLAPTLVAPSASILVGLGQTLTLHVAATSIPELGCQWFCNGAWLNGATQQTLIITNVSHTNAGWYEMLASNYAGMTLSEPILVTVADPPTIIAPPVDQRVDLGKNASFSVTVDGYTPMSVQWWFNQTNPVPGGNLTLTITNVQPQQVGSYCAVITNAVGSVTSQPVWLRLNIPAPSIANAQLGVDGTLHFSLAGLAGIPYVLLESTNLVSWTTNQSITLGADVMQIKVPANAKQVFYRLREQ
jgi:hypothetical protein